MIAWRIALWTSTLAAKYLGMTESALRQKMGITIPTVDLGDRKLWFGRVELDRWIDRRPRRGV